MSRCTSCVLLIVGFLSLFLASAPGAGAQTQRSDRDSIASYVASTAKTVYSLAWPTATYKTWELDGIRPTDHGFEVSVKLTGTSAFDGEDLWLRLAIVFTDGKFDRFRVVDDNAILMRPFATSALVGATAVYLANQYAASNGQPSASPSTATSGPPRQTAPAAPTQVAPTPETPTETLAPQEGVCLVNTTGRDLNYQYLAGSTWKSMTLSTGNSMVMWRNRDEHPVDGAPQYYVRYLDGSSPDAPERNYKLPTGVVSAKPDCKDAPNYHFGYNGEALQIFTGASMN